MAAPRGVELKEDVLIIVNDKLLVAVSHNGRDRTLLRLRDGLRLDARLHFAIEDVLDEFADILGVHFLGLVVGILGVLLGVLDGKGGELLGIEVKVISVGTEQLRVNGGDVNSTAVLFSNRLELLRKFLTLLGGFRENVCQRDTSLQAKLDWNLPIEERQQLGEYIP